LHVLPWGSKPAEDEVEADRLAADEAEADKPVADKSEVDTLVAGKLAANRLAEEGELDTEAAAKASACLIFGAQGAQAEAEMIGISGIGPIITLGGSTEQK
jgi:hypothetical protein